MDGYDGMGFLEFLGCYWKFMADGINRAAWERK